MPDDTPADARPDLAARFRTLAFLLALGLAAAVVGAASTGDGLGIFTIQQAIMGLALATLVVAGVLGVVLMRLSTVFAELRTVRAETQVLRHHLSTTEEKQHVIIIEGIGEAYASRLNSIGVITVPQLLRADAQQIARLIDCTPEIVVQWQAMGRLMQVKGIGPQYAELLVRAGIMSVPELARADPARLTADIDTVQAGRKTAIQKGEVGLRTVERWVAAAADHLNQSVVRMPTTPAGG